MTFGAKSSTSVEKLRNVSFLKDKKGYTWKLEKTHVGKIGNVMEFCYSTWTKLKTNADEIEKNGRLIKLEIKKQLARLHTA